MTTIFTFAQRRFKELKDERAKLLDRLALLLAKVNTAKAPDKPVLQAKIAALQSEIRSKELDISRFLDYNGSSSVVGESATTRYLRPVPNKPSSTDDDDNGGGEPPDEIA